jgi:O-antigen/teichoic acid export membrane protein
MSRNGRSGLNAAVIRGRIVRAGGDALRSPTTRSIFLYALAFGFAGLTPFVLLPILTHRLSPTQFGQATSWIILAGLIANIFGLTTHGLISVRYYKIPRDRLQTLTTTALAVVAAAHAILVLGVILAPGALERLTDLPRIYSLGAAGAAVAISFNLIGLSVMQISGRAGLYLTLRIVQSAIEIGGCVLLLNLLAVSPDVRILSYVAAVGGSALCGVAFLASQGLLRRAPDVSSGRDVLRFGMPMVPHVLAGQLLSNLDRLMISYVLGVKQLGIFMVASQLGMALSLVIEPLNRALAPWLFEHLAKNDVTENERIIRGTYALFAGLFVIALFSATIFIGIFDNVFTREYATAKLVVLPIAIGMAFQGMYYCVVNYVFYAEATARLSMLSSATVSMAVGWSYLLIKNWGLAGAGISFMLTNATLFVVVWYLARKVIEMPWFRFGASAT